VIKILEDIIDKFDLYEDIDMDCGIGVFVFNIWEK